MIMPPRLLLPHRHLPPRPRPLPPRRNPLALLHALGHRVSALAPRRKYIYAAEADGRKLKWEAELKTPHDDGFDRKCKWESNASPSGATTKVKWTKEIKGKGCLQPWSHAYSLEEAYGDDDHDDKVSEKKTAANKLKIKEEGHCLRDLAVAKAKLKEIKPSFYNILYRRRIVHDSEECQRFAEKIIVLLLTVDALEGPDYMVRNAKRSILEELEGMLEIVDPQPPGKPRTLSRRKFDLS